MRFKLKSGEPFAFAGLWDSWKQPDGSSLRTYTIVTTEPNDVLRPIHNRMPAMLSNDDAQKWVAVDDEIAHALTLLKPFPADAMEGGHIVETDAQPWGKITHHGLPGIPALSTANAARPAPWIGVNNDEVFGGVLRLSKTKIEELKKAEAIK